MDSVLIKQISFIPKSTTLNGIIVLTHIVGVIGLSSPWSDLFISITPIHLMLIFAILIVSHGKISKSFIIFLSFVVSASYFIEFVGVNTGSIFGNYSYGKALGLKLGDTPLLIGILWFTLIYSIGTMLAKLRSNIFLRSIAGASLMLLIDLFIEPVAITFDFWSWENDTIPVQNYLAWFVISFFFLTGFNLYSFEKSNPTAKTIFYSQLFFFVAINIII
jgi:putative membrane protein